MIDQVAATATTSKWVEIWRKKIKRKHKRLNGLSKAIKQPTFSRKVSAENFEENFADKTTFWTPTDITGGWYVESTEYKT